MVTRDDQGTTLHKLVLQETKSLAGQVIETILMSCMGTYVFTNTLDDGAKPKAHSTGCLHKENTNWKLKRGKGACSKGVYFESLRQCLKQIHL